MPHRPYAASPACASSTGRPTATAPLPHHPYGHPLWVPSSTRPLPYRAHPCRGTPCGCPRPRGPFRPPPPVGAPLVCALVRAAPSVHRPPPVGAPLVCALVRAAPSIHRRPSPRARTQPFTKNQKLTTKNCCPPTIPKIHQNPANPDSDNKKAVLRVPPRTKEVLTLQFFAPLRVPSRKKMFTKNSHSACTSPPPAHPETTSPAHHPTHSPFPFPANPTR